MMIPDVFNGNGWLLCEDSDLRLVYQRQIASTITLIEIDKKRFTVLAFDRSTKIEGMKPYKMTLAELIGCLQHLEDVLERN